MSENTIITDKHQDKPQNEVVEQFNGVLTTLSSFKSQITMLQNQVRGLEKTVGKQMRAFQREAKKSKNSFNIGSSFKQASCATLWTSLNYWSLELPIKLTGHSHGWINRCR